MESFNKLISKEIMHKWNDGKWVFRDIHGYGYPYYHVHPYKQEAVKYLVDNSPSWIDYIIIFGSSVRLSHLWFKDLDVCLIGENPEGEDSLYRYQRGMRVKGISYDFVDYGSLEEFCRKADKFAELSWRILKEGVMVYER